jgi:hypothetical protein
MERIVTKRCISNSGGDSGTRVCAVQDVTGVGGVGCRRHNQTGESGSAQKRKPAAGCPVSRHFESCFEVLSDRDCIIRSWFLFIPGSVVLEGLQKKRKLPGRSAGSTANLLRTGWARRGFGSIQMLTNSGLGENYSHVSIDFPLVGFATAMTSISTFAPLGSAATWTVERAGGSDLK